MVGPWLFFLFLLLEVASPVNLPYSVDADRHSDGISSRSPLTATSPSFPEDRSMPSGTERRESHAVAKRASEILQGVGGRWDGSFEAEKRAVKREGASIAPTSVFAVNAARRWNPSAFAIQRGETYGLQVQLPNFWVDGFLNVTTEGYLATYDAASRCYVAGGRCRSYPEHPRRFPQANWFELVCAIGEATENLPFREEELTETLFSVGQGLLFKARYTGELVCFANDADTLYWNNRGTIHLNVTRLSWPPTPRTDARRLLTEEPR